MRPRKGKKAPGRFGPSCTVLAGIAAAPLFAAAVRAETPGPAACEALAANAASPDTAITAVQTVTGGSFTPPGATAALAGLPDFCRVAGTIAPTAESAIHFEVWLPLNTWNGRYLQVGNGGFAGTIRYDNLSQALRANFATASTDNGSDTNGPVGSWALGRPQRIIDFAERAVHLTSLRAKELLRAFYERPAEYNYWSGCSEGGREGLVEAQRFPQDFDGILVGAPAQWWTHLFASFIWNRQALQADPAAVIPASKAPAIQAAALGQCDAAGDGVREGVVGEARACAFDPSALLCTGEETDQCLTAPQVRGLTRVYQGAHNPRTGARIFTGSQPGAEADPAANGWTRWLWAQPAPQQFIYGDAFFRYFVFDDPDWDYRTFDFDRDMAYTDAKPIDDRPLGRLLNAMNPNLRRFSARGGKMIQYHGLNDPAIAPSSIHYYESVLRSFSRSGEDRSGEDRSGGDRAGEDASIRRDALRRVQDFYRFYAVPGMVHCNGGPGPNAFGQQGAPAVPADAEHNALVALQRWVEGGVAPGPIVATKYTNDTPAAGVLFTRPLCPYPQTATYTGGGDPNDAANFACIDQGLSLDHNPGLTLEREPISPSP